MFAFFLALFEIFGPPGLSISRVEKTFGDHRYFICIKRSLTGTFQGCEMVKEKRLRMQKNCFVKEKIGIEKLEKMKLFGRPNLLIFRSSFKTAGDSIFQLKDKRFGLLKLLRLAHGLL